MSRRISFTPNEELYKWLEEMAERENQKLATMVSILLDREKFRLQIEKELGVK